MWTPSGAPRYCGVPQSRETNHWQNREIIVKFATRNIREHVFRAKSDLIRVNQQNEGKPKIYINEDLTQFRAGLAREAHSYRASGLISDTWTIYGKVMIKFRTCTYYQNI